MSTSYHAKYFAHELTRQGGDGVDRLSRSLFDASVDLNPHQIDAAQFVLRSPLVKGVLLADEVGLGKTIEAALVLCQYWAERRRKLLIICPASLRKQWALELEEKFNLPTLILDAKTHKQEKAKNLASPFDSNRIVITSIHYASRKADKIKQIGWDMVVIDEAHKLRNAYRSSNRMGQNIRWALEDCRKMLLTATPLQNSLLELYGLSTLIDDRLFGDLPSFRTQYMNQGGDLIGLRNRLQSFCLRTLRRQVLEYIKYTERLPILQKFTPTENEFKLYEAVSAFLQREDTYALPAQQRHLTVLIMRKLLASSPRAVAGTLEVMRNRLIAMRDNLPVEEDMAGRLVEEEELEYELLDEILGQENEREDEADDENNETETEIDREKLQQEIDELDRYKSWASSIGVDTKAKNLLKSLEIGFAKMVEIGATRRAVVFTESRRTQTYLKEFLETNGYLGKVVTFNGVNNDPDSTAIYQRWMEKNKESGRTTGSRPIDVRTALIEQFRDEANIMVATEAAAEGINLQFCSLVVNYDLPWNPQRIEQRIGRCHRYGQKHDVVVINFLNKRNAADRRVYDLLQHKFKLFDGVFGSSDEVLGTLESGMDFERRIFDIYQKCRTQEDIESAFGELQKEMDQKIKLRMQDTRQKLLEHFDEDVTTRLKVNLEGTRILLDKIGRMFWRLSKFILVEHARFDDKELAFDLLSKPIEKAPKGSYRLITKDRNNITGDFLYRLSHPLGEHVLDSGKALDTQVAEVSFDVSKHPSRIIVVEKLKGKSGWLILKRLVVKSFDIEEHLLFSAFTDSRDNLDQETCEKLFTCNGHDIFCHPPDADLQTRLEKEAKRHIKATISRSLEENNKHFHEAAERLDAWADDKEKAADKELLSTKEQLKVAKRLARQTETLEEQKELQQKIKQLERSLRKQRQQIFDIQDQISEERDGLIDALEKRMTQKTTQETLFTIRWNVV